MYKTSCIIELRPEKLQDKNRRKDQMNERNQTNDLHSLSHMKWSCKYHVVFAPKYGRQEFYESRRVEIVKILRELCEWKDVNILEAEV
jgi:putative transposase